MIRDIEVVPVADIRLNTKYDKPLEGFYRRTDKPFRPQPMSGMAYIAFDHARWRVGAQSVIRPEEDDLIVSLLLETATEELEGGRGYTPNFTDEVAVLLDHAVGEASKLHLKRVWVHMPPPEANYALRNRGFVPRQVDGGDWYHTLGSDLKWWKRRSRLKCVG